MKHLKILVLAFLMALCGLSQTSPVVYHGGRVLVSGVTAYVIYYGNVTAAQQLQAHGFLSNIGGSSYFAGTGFYYDSTGAHIQNSVTLAGEATDSYSQGSGTLNSTAVPVIIENAVAKNGWPASTEAIYVVMFSGDVSTILGSAWHGQMPLNGVQVQFVVATAGGTYILSHEFIESTTDALASGWFNASGYEVADICQLLGQSGGTIAMNGVDYVVAAYWVNGTGCWLGGSVVAPPPPPPPQPPPCNHGHKGCRSAQ